MPDLAALIVPAVSALLGVVTSQVWTSRQARTERVERNEQRLMIDRRQALARFLVALNRAIDETRNRVRTGNDADPRAGRDFGWADAYERKLELLLLLPEDGRVMVDDHIARAYRWRDAALATSDLDGVPVNEDLIQQLQIWTVYAGLGRRNPLSRRRD
ncbi:hypothetical protein DFJ67_7345 [Asanoa ferruginea]|uniref:Uncharacterized protein n=1 Tax=Asanoa ferruginea TaxID=53367 RepID=A0A3D9ZXF9_9ACTN|nr:hypothetical protein [Asanoa ferruginea]REG01265.1 hypothetical protein DFJ67_7345 [Asanoa ferruginea]GIF51452.1 hypothetical protein Afe04nite_59910 [Asanoa ferruginea]